MLKPQENISTSSTALEEIERLMEKYEFRDKKEVTDFILAHPQLETLLLEALGPIAAVFPGSPLSLEVFHNPEYQDSDQLIINISTALDVKEGLAELDKIDRGWWGSNINRAAGKLSIDLDFQ